MTEDLSHSIALMRDVVARLSAGRGPVRGQHGGIGERETMIAILEEQIREMEREQSGAWS